MPEVIYLTLEQVLEARRKALEVSDSEDTAAADYGAVESILEHIQNDDYYPTFESKLTHLLFGLAKFHCFADGNKRTALASTLYMLLINGHSECADNFLRNNENIVVDVAASRIGKELLVRIIAAKIAGSFDDDEGLKVEIYEALSAAVDAEHT